MGNIKYKYSVFSGLGEINLTDYILDGNKYTIKVSTGMGLLDKEYKTEVELTNEEMTAIEEMFRELGEYSKDPASKESAMIYDAGYSIFGSSDEYEQFEMHNNEKATHIANKIDEMVKNNHKEFDEMYATIDADIFEANERFRKRVEAQNQGLVSTQAQEMSSKVPEMILHASKENVNGGEESFSLYGNTFTISRIANSHEVYKKIELSAVELEYIRGIFEQVKNHVIAVDNHEVITKTYNVACGYDSYDYSAINDEESYLIAAQIEKYICDRHPEMQEFKDNAQKMIDEGLGTHVIYDIPEPDINLDNEMPEVTVDQDLVNSLSGLLREKYPSLYDENGTLKPEAMDIIDLLIKTYIPEITATTEKEQEQPEAVPYV